MFNATKPKCYQSVKNTRYFRHNVSPSAWVAVKLWTSRVILSCAVVADDMLTPPSLRVDWSTTAWVARVD